MPNRYITVEEPSREIRIALVVSGGISLAVYMHGVVMELLRMVQAPYHPINQDNPYSRLKNLLDGEIIVDIISGTSAGGINGILLAKALATGSDFNLDHEKKKRVADLWINYGDLKLLLKKHGFPGESPITRLLNGDYMLRKLEEVLQEMSQQTNPSNIKIHALDLFVTTLHLRGKEWHYTNHLGHTVYGLDLMHRFHLRYRSNYEHTQTTRTPSLDIKINRSYKHNDFINNDQHLAKISRATSCIPGVFPPVEFTDKDNKTLYLYDGGPVDNRPFEPILNTIYQRSADKEVDRWLIFVDPDPDITEEKLKKDKGKPKIFEDLSSYGSPVKYQNLKKYFDEIEQQNANAERYEKLIDYYMNHSLDDKLIENTSNHDAYKELRKIQFIKLFMKNLEGLLGKTGLQKKITLNSFEKTLKNIIEPNDLCNPKISYDIEFFYRFIHYYVKRLNLQMKKALPADKKILGKYKDTLFSGIEYLREINWAWWKKVETLLEELKFKEKKRVKTIENVASFKLLEEVINENQLKIALANLNTNEELSVQHILNDYMKAIEIWRNEFIEKNKHEIEKILAVAQNHNGKSIWEYIENFTEKDTFFFPLTIGQKFAMNKIDFLRISAGDAKTLGFKPEDKLAGEEWFHFSAFFNKDYRINDIMWGRLDTVDIVFEHLIKKYFKDQPEKIKEINQIRYQLFNDIINEEMPELNKIFIEEKEINSQGHGTYDQLKEKLQRYSPGKIKNTKLSILFKYGWSIIKNIFSILKYNLSGIAKGITYVLLGINLLIAIIGLFFGLIFYLPIYLFKKIFKWTKDTDRVPSKTTIPME